MGEGADEGALVVVVEGFLAQPGGGGWTCAIDRNRSIGGRGLPLLGLPIAGACGFEGLDDIAEAPPHWFEHFDDTVEMVGHADTGMHGHFVAVAGLLGGDCLPFLPYFFAQWGQVHIRVLGVITKPA